MASTRQTIETAGRLPVGTWRLARYAIHRALRDGRDVAAFLLVLNLAIAMFGTPLVGVAGAPPFRAAHVAIWLVTAAVGFVAGAGMLRVAVSRMQGRDSSLRQGMTMPLGRLLLLPVLPVASFVAIGVSGALSGLIALPLLLVAHWVPVMAVVGAVVGMAALAAVSLYLVARWALIMPVMAVEGGTIRHAFSRSASLTKGSRWPVLGLSMLFLSPSIGLGFLVAVPRHSLPYTPWDAPLSFGLMLCAQTVVQTISGVLDTFGLAALYIALTRRDLLQPLRAGGEP